MSGLWIVLSFFAFVMTAVTVAGYLFWIRANPNRASEMPAVLSTDPALPPARAAFLDIFRSIGENFPNARKEHNPHRARLALAGYRWPSAVPVFYGIKSATTLFFSGAAGVSALLFGSGLSNLPIAMLCGAGIGFLVPDQFLSSSIRARAVRLRKALPAALDLMVLGLEAGQSLDSTVADASRCLKIMHPDLSGELAQLCLELRTSSSRAEAFRNFADRNNEAEVRKFSNLMIDSDRFGVALGPALRSHNRYLRTRFRQQAQEAARKVGVKLIFPVFFLIFPSVLLVTLGPACIMMMKQLQNLIP